ncbi:RNA polymerase sigma factor [Aquimarina addita]|uniref:RNA polymerase sigma factor n=1 Tax=Aquimarina addita TaxID=870485 RepID=A0ABP7X9S2_9FLAO
MCFQEIYKQYRSLVFTISFQYCQNKEDAEEIMQDVFISVYENFDSFNSKSSIKTWIYRITVNQALDFIKAKKRNKRSFFFSAVCIDTPHQNISSPIYEKPDKLLEEKESIARIYKGVHQLPENQKKVILLLKIEQNTQDETAKIMNKSTKSIESLYQRAKKNLQYLLEQNEEKSVLYGSVI